MSNLTNDNRNSGNKKARLGRGIGSLLGGSMDPGLTDGLSFEDTPAKEASHEEFLQAISEKMVTPEPPPTVETGRVENETQRIWNVEIHKLQVNSHQPRKHFAKEALQDLAASIKEKGILQPITARRVEGGGLEIIAGERRWRAAQLAGLSEVPVIIRAEMSSQDSFELAIIENIQRQELNAIEEALAYQRLSQDFNLTQQEISQKVGKERASIANTLRLLSLIPEVQQLVIDGRISMGHARALLAIDDAKKQLEVATQVAEGKLSVRATEKLASQVKQGPESVTTQSSAGDLAQRLAQSLSEDLQKRIGTRVAIDYSSGKGKLSIYFYSDSELNQIAERIKEAWLIR